MAYIILQKPLPWPVADCQATFDSYGKRRFKPKAINLPTKIELAIMAEIANLYLDEENFEQYRNCVETAIFDAGGRDEIQQYLLQCNEQPCNIASAKILGLQKDDGDSSNDDADKASD